jgi:hypothetical protein
MFSAMNTSYTSARSSRNLALRLLLRVPEETEGGEEAQAAGDQADQPQPVRRLLQQILGQALLAGRGGIGRRDAAFGLQQAGVVGRHSGVWIECHYSSAGMQQWCGCDPEPASRY